MCIRDRLKVLHRELGDGDEDSELERYEEKILALKLVEETEEKLLKEVSRLAKQPSGSSEAAVIRNYLDTCLELPWNTRTRERVDIRMARRILDEDHFGLEKVKERILEILAVKKLAPDLPGPVSYTHLKPYRTPAAMLTRPRRKLYSGSAFNSLSSL